MIGTGLASPFFCVTEVLGRCLLVLILIGFDTEMPVERKEGVGLALPSHIAPLQPDLAAAGLRDSLALMHFLPPKNSQPNR